MTPTCDLLLQIYKNGLNSDVHQANIHAFISTLFEKSHLASTTFLRYRNMSWDALTNCWENALPGVPSSTIFPERLCFSRAAFIAHATATPRFQLKSIVSWYKEKTNLIFQWDCGHMRGRYLSKHPSTPTVNQFASNLSMSRLTSELMPTVLPPNPWENVACHAVSRWNFLVTSKPCFVMKAV